MAVYFVAGIDTGVGKTVATGLLARHLALKGVSVITAKLAQTGCADFSEDVALHRTLMGLRPFKEDGERLTCPWLFRYPASPALAARLDGVEPDISELDRAFDKLAGKFDALVVEGVGGWLAPLTDKLTCGDYVVARGWPVVVVSSPRLGSINHTHLTLEAIRARGLDVVGIVYNMGVHADRTISEDTRGVLLKALKACGRPGALVDLPPVPAFDNPPEVDFSPIFKGFCHE